MAENKNRLFRIGELSKIFHLPVKTLRYYSDIGLLTPAYTDPDSGYRYYSVDQFVLIDVIRNSRKMGMSLDEIKTYLQSDQQANEIIPLIDQQIDDLEEKINEYIRTRDSMKAIRDAIMEAEKVAPNVPYISDEAKQYYVAYPYVSTTPEEQELNFRKAALSGGEHSEQVYAIFGVSTRADEYFKTGKIINPEVRSFLPGRDESCTGVMPAGKYACIVFEDNVHAKEKYYALLSQFLTEQKLLPIGDFSEEWIIPRVKDGRESTLIKIKIQVDA